MKSTWLDTVSAQTRSRMRSTVEAVLTLGGRHGTTEVYATTATRQHLVVILAPALDGR